MKFYRKRGDEVKDRIQNRYEIIMLYIIAVVNLIKDLYVIGYPYVVFLTAFLVYGFIGGVEAGNLTTVGFLKIICSLALIFTMLTIIYLYLKNGRRND